MTAATALAGLVEVSGVALAPLLPGLVQTAKGRLQGRRGPSPLQPYRELRRLWRRSRVTPEPHSIVYELAPLVVAGAALLALLLLPIGSHGASWGLGHDAIVLVGLLALARFAIAAAAWDTGSAFALMGAGRDLTFAVFVEALFVLVIVLLALPAASTDLVTMSAVAADGDPWREPVRWAAVAAMALVVIAETGRQPIDNPDTHLELTMVHEGPLLEYAGRDQALLQWAAAARHWIMLVLVAEVALPHPGPFMVQLAWLAGWLVALALLLAVVETVQAKMRILRVPLLLGGGVALCLLGLVSSILGSVGVIGEPLMVALAACGLAVVVVRRRSVAIVLVAAQSLALGIVAIADGLGESAALSTAGVALVAKAVVLPVLLLWVVRRTREPRLIEERHALTRAVAAATVTLALVALVPPVLSDHVAQRGAVALLALGIAIAILRRAAIFHALGFLVAENGLYIAALAAPGGLPAVIELGFVFDLVVVVVVAAAFSAKIHEHLGTGDTSLLGELRD